MSAGARGLRALLRERDKPEGEQSPEAVAFSMTLAAFIESALITLTGKPKKGN